MEEGNIVEHLVSIVPGVEGTIPWVVIQHGDVRVLILQRDINILIGRGVGVVSIVDLCPSRVPIGYIECATNHKGFTCAALWMIGCP